MARDIVTGDLVDNTELIGGWDWENKHVNQSYTVKGESPEISISDIVESGTVLIAAGPADISAAVKNSQGGALKGFRVVPIGLIENATIAMNKPLSRIFEIGSKLSYIIPGRTVGEIALARVLFDGPSLLKVIYQGEVYQDEYLGLTDKKQVSFYSSRSGLDTSKAQIVQPIGSGNIAMNLASSFFEQPVGLAFYFRDQESSEVGQIYFEGCRVSTYNMGISANMNVLTESIRMEFVKCTPVTSGTDSRTPSLGDIDPQNGAGLPDLPIIGMLGEV